MNQDAALTIIGIADQLTGRFGAAGGGHPAIREAIDALGVYEDVNEATEAFARSFLHTHFDTGLNINTWAGAKDWLDTVFVDFDTITVPGDW